MDIAFPYLTNVLLSIFAVFLFLYSVWCTSRNILKNSSKRKNAAPEAKGSWPLIGHLHFLAGGGSKPVHQILGDMHDKYGPIFILNVGVHPTLIVSNWEIAKECFTKNDKAFSGRPKTLSFEILGYDASLFGMCTYGPYWRQMRKIATLELLSNHRLETFKDVRESEVRTLMKKLYKLWEKNKNDSDKVLVEMMSWFGDLSLNMILKMIVGKSVGYATMDGGDEKKELKKIFRDYFDMMGEFLVSDALPFLRWLDIGGREKAMRRTASEVDKFLVEWLREHKQKGDFGGGENGKDDFMGMMLKILDASQLELDGRDSDTVIKANCLGLILAGFDTTTVTLSWALSLLINNRDVLRKTQLEIDTCIGKERQVEESDLKNLAYLNAVVKEAQRLYPAAPLSLPHESIEDCTVGGYHIPAGTRLITNLWKIHHDPRVWLEPSKFHPEKFLTTHKDIDVRGQNFELMPFGTGRRMCSGVSLALQLMQLTLATLLQAFDFETPSGGPIDMQESAGLTNVRASPLEVLLIPRLPPHIYG